MELIGPHSSIPTRKRPADSKQDQTPRPRKSPRLLARKRQTDSHQAETIRPEKAARLSSTASTGLFAPDTSSRARKITTVEYKTPPKWTMPDLNNTLDELKTMASEAATLDEELHKHQASFKKDLDDFVTVSAEPLQKKLLKQSRKPSGWLKPFWDEMYLKARNATPINVSFAVEFDKSAWLEKPSHEQLADVILAVSEHYDQLQAGTLPQDTYTTRDKEQHPVCMDQVLRLFNNRKPKQEKDILKPCAEEEDTSNKEQSILVLSGGHMHTLQIADKNGHRIERSHLAKLLAFLQTKKSTRSAVDLTPLTAVDRDLCATLQTQLLHDSGKNARLMQQVDSAFCCVCLDRDQAIDAQDVNPDSTARQFLAGNGNDRWFDKTVQIVMQADGKIGATLEHTPADADAYLPIFKRINDNFSAEPSTEGNLTPTPKKLDWDINPSLKEFIQTQRSHFKNAIKATHLKEIEIPDIGRATLRGKHNISPDSFYQVAFQVAAWRTWESMVPTYESVAMRHLHLGRTECLRSWSAEAIALAKGLQDPQTTDKQKQALLIQAAERHSKKIKDCKAGKGIVRHLFALKKTWEKFGPKLGIPEKPRLFENPLFKALINTNTLSTSCVVSPAVRRFLFGPVEDDGLGIAYYPNDQEFRMTISYNGKNEEKATAFELAFKQVVDKLTALLSIPKSDSS